MIPLRAVIALVVLALIVWIILSLGGFDGRDVADDTTEVRTVATSTSTTSSPTTSTTSTTVAPTTTTTARARTAPTVRPATAASPVTVAPTGGARRSTSSTMYCQGTTMANGQHVHVGAVSSKVLPRGSRWRVLTGPYTGRLFVVEDTGSKAYFDMYTPSCPEAVQYGRRQIEIEAA